MRKYNINLSESFMIGDSCTDIIAGNTVGTSTIFIGDLKCDLCKKLGDIMPTYIAKDLTDASKNV